MLVRDENTSQLLIDLATLRNQGKGAEIHNLVTNLPAETKDEDFFQALQFVWGFGVKTDCIEMIRSRLKGHIGIAARVKLTRLCMEISEELRRQNIRCNSDAPWIENVARELSRNSEVQVEDKMVDGSNLRLYKNF